MGVIPQRSDRDASRAGGGPFPASAADSPGGRGLTAYDAVRVLLAAILLVAAAFKGYQLATEPVANADIFSYRWSLTAQVEFEIVLGVWLLSGLFRRLGWLAATECFALFTGVTLYKALSGAASCGCFGKVEVSPWYTLILDVWAVSALLVFPPDRAAWLSPANVRRLAMAGLATLLLAVPAGVAMGSYQPARVTEDGVLTTAGRFVVLEPERWVGKRFPLLKYVDVGERLAKGKWIVIFKRHGCHGCEESIPRYERMAAGLLREKSPVSVAMIELEPTRVERAAQARRKARGLRVPSASRPRLDGFLPAEKEWFVTTPAVVVLEDGKVLAGWEGEAPYRRQLMKGYRMAVQPVPRIAPERPGGVAGTPSAVTCHTTAIRCGGPVDSALRFAPRCLCVAQYPSPLALGEPA